MPHVRDTLIQVQMNLNLIDSF